MKVQLLNVRLAFPDLFTPKSVQGSDPAYSASFLLPPDHPSIKTIKDVIEQVGKDKWGAKWPTVKKMLEAKDKTCLHDGDLKSNYVGFEGNMYVSARNKVRPLVINRDKSPLTQADGVVYAGCYVNGLIDVWAMDNEYGQRVSATLNGVQFVKKGDAFGGGSTATSDDFDDLGVEETDTVDDLV